MGKLLHLQVNNLSRVTFDAHCRNDLNVGAVSALRRIKSAMSVARHVLEHTHHSMLAGDQATEFAKMMGFNEESLTTDSSRTQYFDWLDNNCQPNFWTVTIFNAYSISTVSNAINCSFLECCA